MPHLHELPGQHDLTISAFIIRTDGPEPAILLHTHRKIGMLLQFGGHVEHDETPWQGLVREIAEESGYQASQYAVLQPRGGYTDDFKDISRHPLPYYFNTHPFMQDEHFHSDLVYALVTSEPPALNIAAGESADIHAYTASDLRAFDKAKIYDVTRANALFLLEDLINDWDPVPATEWPV